MATKQEMNKLYRDKELYRALARNAMKTLVAAVGFDKACEMSCPQLRTALQAMRSDNEL